MLPSFLVLPSGRPSAPSVSWLFAAFENEHRWTIQGRILLLGPLVSLAAKAGLGNACFQIGVAGGRAHNAHVCDTALETLRTELVNT